MWYLPFILRLISTPVAILSYSNKTAMGSAQILFHIA